ncbi:MAG: DUF4129 domain-containing protein [Chloroflexota bacterium]
MVFGFPDPRQLARGLVRDRPAIRFGRGDGRSRLLPVLQAVADGALLAILYAAVQALVGQRPLIGPLELALLVGVGMGWARRRRWNGAGVDMPGTILLAILAGALTWFLDPDVRAALVAGNTDAAFILHLPGWVGAIAFLRGRSHASRDDDEDQQDRLLRFGIPALALPWLAGHLGASGTVERAFVSAAFVSTLLFAASGFTALGLARLELVRRGSADGSPARRSWLLLVGGIALAVTLVGIPAAALLGVPVAALTATVFGPLRVILLSLLLLTTPLIVAIAALTDLIGPLLPRGIQLPRITIPSLRADPVEVSSTPTIVFFTVLGILLVLELAAVGLYLWYRMRERRREQAAELIGFEERSIVRPAAEPPVAAVVATRRPARGDPSTAVGAYLAALELLSSHAGFARRPSESPAAHARRITPGLATGALVRLSADYQLERYAAARITSAERRRLAPRLAALRHRLRSIR